MPFTWNFGGKCLKYSSVLAIFDGNIWLSIFFIVLLGTLFGMIPFGPLRFGAAGTLFVGLAFGSFIDLDKDILSSLQELGSVSYTHLTLPTKSDECRCRWSGCD